MNFKALHIIFFFAMIISSCAQKKNTCVIIGKVIGRPESTQLRMVKSFTDHRTQSVQLIPIIDSTFTYQFDFADVQAYDLIFDDEYRKNMMRPITFFASNDTIKMELYPAMQFDKNTIVGGEVNVQFLSHRQQMQEKEKEKLKPINDSINSLWVTDNYYSQAVKDLVGQVAQIENEEEKRKMNSQLNDLYMSEEGLSPSCKKLRVQGDSINTVLLHEEIEYIRNNMTIPSYYSLINIIVRNKPFVEKGNLANLIEIQKSFATKYNNHPYTQYSSELLWRYANLKPGGDYFDFTLPDLDSTNYTLSNQIKGKYAVIDIWAPWCTPCIAKSRELKSIFEDFGTKGFTVVGVAYKYEKYENIAKVVNKEDYPWITLVDKPELDSRVTEHYGLENDGGGIFLVNPEGKIVLVEPTPEEIRKVLEADL